MDFISVFVFTNNKYDVWSIQYDFIAKCQCNSAGSVLWYKVYSSFFQANHKTNHNRKYRVKSLTNTFYVENAANGKAAKSKHE